QVAGVLVSEMRASASTQHHRSRPNRSFMVSSDSMCLAGVGSSDLRRLVLQLASQLSKPPEILRSYTGCAPASLPAGPTAELHYEWATSHRGKLLADATWTPSLQS